MKAYIYKDGFSECEKEIKEVAKDLKHIGLEIEEINPLKNDKKHRLSTMPAVVIEKDDMAFCAIWFFANDKFKVCWWDKRERKNAVADIVCDDCITAQALEDSCTAYQADIVEKQEAQALKNKKQRRSRGRARALVKKIKDGTITQQEAMQAIKYLIFMAFDMFDEDDEEDPE